MTRIHQDRTTVEHRKHKIINVRSSFSVCDATRLTFTIPQRKDFPFPATKSRTNSPSNRATTRDRYVRSIRKIPWLRSRPASLLDHRGIIILSRLKNWCKKAKFNPGFVWADGTVPSPRPDTRGGFKKSRRCASNVNGFVVLIITLEVPSL
jgi:hypothetical protein